MCAVVNLISEHKWYLTSVFGYKKAVEAEQLG